MDRRYISGWLSEINNLRDIYIYIKNTFMGNTKKVIDKFLEFEDEVDINELEPGQEKTVCDRETGECYVIRTKDGLVERINKKYIIEDGRQLLQD